MTAIHDTDGAPVIIGGGLAGLMTALALAPLPVLLVTKAPLGLEASSALAQGGIAASLGADDNMSLHLADTLAAGDGLCDQAIASDILAAAPAAIEQLVRHALHSPRCSGNVVLSRGRPRRRIDRRR
jgi:L-aspartate oxidase